MKTKLLLSLFFILVACSSKAQNPQDTTVVILRETGPGNPAPINDPIIPHSEPWGNYIEVCYTAQHLLLNPDDFNSQFITVVISDFFTGHIYYEDELLSGSNIGIDISSLPIGIYTISIIDGDDEYLGEFEVF